MYLNIDDSSQEVCAAGPIPVEPKVPLGLQKQGWAWTIAYIDPHWSQYPKNSC